MPRRVVFLPYGPLDRIRRLMSVDLDPIAFDHRIREELVRDLRGERSGRGRLGRRQIELEVFALPDILDRAVAERMERVGDRLALRVEDRRLERDEDTS